MNKINRLPDWYKYWIKIQIIFRVFFLLIGINNNVFCQKDSLRLNSIFIELSGLAAEFSLNYEHQFLFSDNIGLNIGIGYSPISFNEHQHRHLYSPRFPIQIKTYYQFKKHTFDFGGAITPYIWHETEYSSYNSDIALFGQIGYKYFVFNDLCYIGIAFCPNIFDNGKFLFFPWGALRFGYKF
ncbi:MAG: hypothetical protein HY738_21330 [Bacteroidia bacterium]|nr:hypothetical protein [Bacteroidia bacterium]